MTQVHISPIVEVQELRAIEATLRNRILVLAQAHSEALVLIAERDAQIAALREEIGQLKAAAEPPLEEGGE
ncbi:hypothetical protein [Shinella sp. BYT-45]|uniref:hypothetical protein n=1 Tax=Shinella sp. BYT-45 TaxID=3377377 RepID=UPI003980CA75